MKCSITATATASVLAVLLPLVTAVPTTGSPIIDARQSSCLPPFVDPSVTLLFSVVTDTDSKGKRRWDLFEQSFEDITANEVNELNYNVDSQPADTALFSFEPTSFGGDIFTIYRNFDNFTVVASATSFNAVDPTTSGGTELQFDCAQCPDDHSGNGQLFADQCLVQVAPGGVLSGMCAGIASDEESSGITAVILVPCDRSQSNQLHAIFIQFPDEGALHGVNGG